MSDVSDSNSQYAEDKYGYPPHNRDSRHSYRPTSVADVEGIVMTEMRHRTYKDTKTFLATHFDEKEIPSAFVKAVYNTLVSNKKYIPASPGSRGHWAGLPLDPSDEKGIYAPLTKMLDDITGECARQVEELTKTAGSSQQKQVTQHFDIVWRDEHSRSPVSSHNDSADIWPDIVATFKQAVTAPARKGSPSRVWWRSVHVPLEVKKAANADAAVIQIFRYIRQSLWDQPDRRFMFGLVFARHTLTVWHVDHSGALAGVPINIHENPLDFIRVIVGLAVKSPEALGWDPTMQIYFDATERLPRRARASYTIDPGDLADEGDLYKTKWVVTLPKPDWDPSAAKSDGKDNVGVEDGNERFVLFLALSLSRAQAIVGRVSRVWKAWKWMDMHLPIAERKVYVIKDTWRNARRVVEGALYRDATLSARRKGSAMSGVAQMHSFCIVRINGDKDTTLVAVRRKLKPSGKPLKLDTNQFYARPNGPGSPRDQNVHVFLDKDVFDEDPDEDFPPPADRIHSRLVMATYGWPLLQFHDLPELFGGVHDAIKGHRWLHNHGILHRDISYTNILLTGQDAPNRAVMIDLDNAIAYETHKTLADDERSVGTLAFMSFEVLKSKHYFEGDSDEPEGIKHNLVHDLESYFWVLCWIGVCRKGPGQQRVVTSMPKSQRDNWQEEVDTNFEEKRPKAIANAKQDLILKPKAFGASVLDLLSPYFTEPLRAPLLQLHNALRTAYQKHDYSDKLYETFLKVFDDAAKSNVATSWHARPGHESYAEMEKTVLHARAREQLAFGVHQPALKAAIKRNREEMTGQTVIGPVAEGDDGGAGAQPPQARRQKTMY
ncbi:hypothetical protein FA95DRAFT_1678859 [Auriscalpium vulgare]|uniref:Uncharacterized protein n=1 Tax=Auriscalpium vulgare TaxID=40419 RepID=A0ACB8RV31_9AGAM|nr:hypothetical protein FA95DRAFT_1678859 [Auriscalpium vulgare]